MRNATLGDLEQMLREQHARKVDIVAGAGNIVCAGGDLVVENTEAVLSATGVTQTAGVYRPTSVCDEGIAEKLGIPRAYLRHMRNTHVDLYDDNVNGWLTRDQRTFLVRCFKPDDGGVGVARAFLSDSYKMMDNLDVLVAAFEGIENAGVEVQIDGCDLTDRRMYVRLFSPQVQAMAEELLTGYRNPFGEDFDRWRAAADREGLGFGDGSEPVVFAGFVISNSETGDGAQTIKPRLVVKVCKNGLTITKDALRSVHLGGKLEEGVVNWSDETQEKSLDLVRAKTTDAVRTFLSPGYLATAIAGLEEKSSRPVTKVDEVKVITKSLQFSTEHIDGVLSRFLQGGQMTRGGVMNAITAHAQTVEDADLANKMESEAVKVLA